MSRTAEGIRSRTYLTRDPNLSLDISISDLDVMIHLDMSAKPFKSVLLLIGSSLPTDTLLVLFDF